MLSRRVQHTAASPRYTSHSRSVLAMSVMLCSLMAHASAFGMHLLSTTSLGIHPLGSSPFAASAPRRPLTAGSRCPQARFALRLADDSGEEGLDFNATAAGQSDLGMELLRAKRPKGVGDFVEGIPQAPDTETLSRKGNSEDFVYPAYDSVASDEPGGVGDKVGLEKDNGDWLRNSGGLFADRSGEPLSGRDQIREQEANLLGVFSQEKNFLAGLIGIFVLGLFYVSVWNGSGAGGGLVAPRYGDAQIANVPPGKGKVIERFEEAFVCYGVPTADDPNGCRDKRSVGPVRVFSRAPDPAADADGAGGAGTNDAEAVLDN